jgi:hypothetical protein
LDELRIDTTPDVFFKGLKSMEVNIFLHDLECFTNFEAPMSNKWLDFMLVHTLAKNVVSNKCRYILLNAQASKLLKIELLNRGGTKRWGTKYFKLGSLLNNIVVIPYLDKIHWSLYTMEEGCTIHCDSIPRFHNDILSKEFAQNVHITCALSRGLNDDANFKTFVNVDTILPKVFTQKNRWECGHQVVFNFRTYLQERWTLASFPGHHVSSNSTCHVTFYACYILLIYIMIALNINH